jgi:hypothetical protein
MVWQPIVSHNGIVTISVNTPWVSQKPKELHKVLVERTDAGSAQWVVYIWASLDAVDSPTAPNEAITFQASDDKAEVPVFGYRYFAIGVFSADAGITADVDVVGDDGLNV